MFQDLSASHASSNKKFIDSISNHSISEDDLESIDFVPISNSPSKSTSEITKKLPQQKINSSKEMQVHKTKSY